MKKVLYLLLGGSLLVLGSCKKNDKGPHTYYGTPVTIGDGSARSFITFNAGGQPTAIGIRLSEDALQGLPSEGDPHMGGMIPGYMLDLPKEAAGSGYNHCEVDWNPHGHDPLFAYGVPHFDFHFYMISMEEQAAVIPGPDTVTVAPRYIPEDYVTGVIAVPNMGTHWADTTAPEFHGQPFTATFIYGFYHGEMTFLEPMITKAFLETHPDFHLMIKQPQAFQRHGYYPTRLHLSFDNRKNEYVIAMEDLKYH